MSWSAAYVNSSLSWPLTDAGARMSRTAASGNKSGFRSSALRSRSWQYSSKWYSRPSRAVLNAEKLKRSTT